MARVRAVPIYVGMAALVLAWLVSSAVALAEPIPVGAGEHGADLVLQFGDGALYEFDVAFDGTTTGLGLFDIIEAETTLATIRFDFGFGVFIDGIAFDGHANAGFGGGEEEYWHYWTREAGDATWASSFVGAADRVVTDSDADGWVYGSAVAPIPEPGSAILLAAAALMARRRECRHVR